MKDNAKTIALTATAILVAFALIALGKWGYAKYKTRQATAAAAANNAKVPTGDDDAELSTSNVQ